MKNERSCRFSTKHLIVLGLVSGVLFTAQMATMALANKDREIAALQQHMAKVEDQNRQFLSSLLAGANGLGYSVQLDSHNLVSVGCKIEFEWVNGTFYNGDSGRKLPKRLLIARK